MKVRAHVYRDYKLNVFFGPEESETAYFRERLLKRDPVAHKLARLRYALVSLRWHPRRKKLFIGTTHHDGDILIEFDPAAGKFRSCGYARSGLRERNEVKIHKGLWLDEREDALYFGTSTLSALPDLMGSPGGKLVRYRCRDRKFEMLAAPTPGWYYQATAYDQPRGKMYFYSYPVLGFGAYDLRRKRLVRHDPMMSIPHIGCIDDAGGVWGTWGAYAHAFFRYRPDEDRYEFPRKLRIPAAHEAADIMYKGAGPIDSFLNGGDGFLYVGTALGEVYRLDPQAHKLEFLGKPIPGTRLPGMCLADDGLIYMAGGSDKNTQLARYDRRARRFDLLGPVQDAAGAGCYRPHELVVLDGTAWVCETDNPKRSGYLWECRL